MFVQGAGFDFQLQISVLVGLVVVPDEKVLTEGVVVEARMRTVVLGLGVVLILHAEPGLAGAVEGIDQRDSPACGIVQSGCDVGQAHSLQVAGFWKQPLHQPLLLELKGFDLLGLGGDKVVEGGKGIGNFLLFGEKGE